MYALYHNIYIHFNISSEKHGSLNFTTCAYKFVTSELYQFSHIKMHTYQASQHARMFWPLEACLRGKSQFATNEMPHLLPNFIIFFKFFFVITIIITC